MTVYNLFKILGWQPVQKSMLAVGINVARSARTLKIPYTIIPQIESHVLNDGVQEFQVKDYPDSFEPKMAKIARRYAKKVRDTPNRIPATVKQYPMIEEVPPVVVSEDTSVILTEKEIKEQLPRSAKEFIERSFETAKPVSQRKRTYKKVSSSKKYK